MAAADAPGWVPSHQGAEARVTQERWWDRPVIAKERFAKAYRHPVLDAKLTRARVRETSEAGALVQEARQLAKCQRIGVPAPVVYAVDLQRNVIYMECIDGDPVKAWLRAAPLPEGAATSAAALGPAHLALARAIGRNVARLHDHQIVHGDLTTSNMLVLRGTEGTLAPTVVMIDFGLSYSSTLPEDMAVDLYVLERAFLSTHPNSTTMFREILEAYAQSAASPQAARNVLHRLDDVRRRGRKRTMVG